MLDPPAALTAAEKSTTTTQPNILEAKKRAGGALTQLELFDYERDKFYLTADEEA